MIVISVNAYDSTSDNNNQKKENQTTQSKLIIDDGDYYILGGDMLLDKSDPVDQVIISDLLNEDEKIIQQKLDKLSKRGLTMSDLKKWDNGIVK